MKRQSILTIFISALGALQPVVPSVDVSVPFAPAMVMQDDRFQLVYELHVTNFQSVDVELTTLRVSAGDTLLGDFHATGLQRRFPGGRPAMAAGRSRAHVDQHAAVAEYGDQLPIGAPVVE